MYQAGQSYLYIIFAVLYIAYGIIKAVRKKNQVLPEEGAIPTQPQETFLPTEKIIEKRPQRVISKKVFRSASDKNRTTRVLPLQAHDAANSQAEAKNNSIAYASDSSRENLENEEQRFDIRQAIIFSEILKRPPY